VREGREWEREGVGKARGEGRGKGLSPPQKKILAPPLHLGYPYCVGNSYFRQNLIQTQI